MPVSLDIKLPSGDAIPILGIGTWKSKGAAVTAAVEHAIRTGYRHIDTAAVYENEREVGAGIKAVLNELVLDRKNLFITSKLWITNLAPADVEPACRKTLEDLGLDYLDLYLIHWPTALKKKPGKGYFPINEDGTFDFDPELDLSNTWLEMEKLLEKGLVKNIGLSNFNSVQITDILDKGSVKPANNQVESHPYLNQAKLIDFCRKIGITITAYSPLGSRDRPWEDGKKAVMADPTVIEIAKRIGKTSAQVLLRWQIQRGIITIPKSVTPSRIEENFDIFDFEIGEDDMNKLNSLGCQVRYCPLDLKAASGTIPNYPFDIEF